MSLILDALKRAERERQAEPSPALGDLPAPRAGRSTRRVPWKKLLLVLALGLIAVAGWKLSHKRARTETASVQAPAPGPSPAQRQTQSPSQRVATPAPAPAPAPLVASAPPPATVIPGTEGVASLDEVTQGEPEPPLPPPRATSGPPARSATPASAPSTPAPQADGSRAQGAAEPEAPPAEASPAPAESRPAERAPPAAQAPPREIPPALTQPAQLRTFREMPPEYRADFPALTIQVHVFEQIPAQRFVIVNNRRYREGETLAEGPQLVEIVREGLVLDYRGERLLYTLSR